MSLELKVRCTDSQVYPLVDALVREASHFFKKLPGALAGTYEGVVDVNMSPETLY